MAKGPERLGASLAVIGVAQRVQVSQNQVTHSKPTLLPPPVVVSLLCLLHLALVVSCQVEGVFEVLTQLCTEDMRRRRLCLGAFVWAKLPRGSKFSAITEEGWRVPSHHTLGRPHAKCHLWEAPVPVAVGATVGAIPCLTVALRRSTVWPSSL